MIGEAATRFVRHEAASVVRDLPDLQTRLRNDPAAELTWESAQLALAYAYDAAEIMFGHEDAEELVQMTVSRFADWMSQKTIQDARLRRLTLQARERLLRQAAQEAL